MTSTSRGSFFLGIARSMSSTRGFSEMGRKTLHVAMGGFALLLAYLTWWQAFILAAVAFLHNLYLLPLYAGERIFRHGTSRRGEEERGAARSAGRGEHPAGGRGQGGGGNASGRGDVERGGPVRDVGILLYPAAIVILILVFRRHLEIVAAAWGLLA